MDDRNLQLWTPAFLRRRVFIVFSLAYLTIIAALAALCQYSSTHQGFVASHPKRYLLWQYGPTAVFNILAAFWGQVEHRVKQLIPWKLMFRKPRSVDRSLLLDFISPLSITSFIFSLKSPDLTPVAVTVGGGFMLKLVTILSTGLFILRYTALERPADIVLSDQFGGPNASHFDYNAVNHQALARLYAIHNLSLPYPPRTTLQHAYQRFNTSSLPQSAVKVTGQASVFHSSLECEVLSLSHAEMESRGEGNDKYMDFRFTSDACGELNQWTTFWPRLNGHYFSLFSVLEPEDMHCADNDRRLITTFGVTAANESSDSVPLDMINSSTILCRPDYGISPGLVVLDTNSSTSELPTISIAANSSNEGFSGVTPSAILDAIYHSWMNTGEDLFLNHLTDYIPLTLPNITRDALTTNATLFAIGMDAFFQAFAAQLADLYFFQPTTEFGFLAIMIILTITSMFMVPKRCVPLDPGPMAGMATILARSPEITSTLHGTGASTLTTIRTRLATSGYVTQMNHSLSDFSIIQTPLPSGKTEEQEEPLSPNGQEIQKVEESEKGKEISWFRPAAVAFPTKLIMVLLPLVLVAALEVLYQKSHKHKGIYNLPSSEYGHYIYTYIPTVILVSMGLLFSGLDFSAKIIQPYQLLCRGGAPANDAFSEDYLSKFGLHCIWRAIARKHVAVASSSVGMLLVPFLTIAASGLFYAETLPQSYDIQLTTVDSFDYTFLSWEYYHGLGWAMANLVLGAGLDEPLFTYRNLLFPAVDVLSPLPSSLSSDTIREGSIATRVPAFRAQSNCSSASLYNFTYSEQLSTVNENETIKYVTFDIVLPKACSPENTSLSLTVSDGDDSAYTSGLYSGSWNEGNFTPYCAHCPDKVVSFSYVRNNTLEDLDVLICTPYLETVEVDVVLNAADFSFNLTAAPPTPIDSTATFVRNLTYFKNIDINLYDGWFRRFGIERVKGAEVDGFFATLIDGVDAIAPADLLPKNDPTHARLHAAIDRLYGRVVAQVLNTQRVVERNQTTQQPINATLTVPDHMRLKQNLISTRALEALLAAISLCALLTYLTLDTKKVLPKNSCSVAAVWSLLAGSRLLEECFSPGSELMSGDHQKGLNFRLGWWPGGRFGLDFEVSEEDGEAEQR
ncbi:uncharacterized protein K452DRAFT_304848 [Aplosporella prunicola CBS 121167]|uniref:Uncharacterized protein n=1 Tax=Aplosporella prunicola CBS 121167 TaxID=1176127 RepID=A0A6A6BVQ9_9PEZI|nr:uncharacterized protein K452DRAFT_304848 [Aplosporella prunicola CBS 121167]KAF2146947.1 hypothetical protein K452DRAFT_304848 [Aplosporella prunicola CBS 121167]